MTKQQAIGYAKDGWETWHPLTNGSISDRTVMTQNSAGISSLKTKIVFRGDCSPKDGWESEYLYAR